MNYRSILIAVMLTLGGCYYEKPKNETEREIISRHMVAVDGFSFDDLPAGMIEFIAEDGAYCAVFDRKDALVALLDPKGERVVTRLDGQLYITPYDTNLTSTILPAVDLGFSAISYQSSPERGNEIYNARMVLSVSDKSVSQPVKIDCWFHSLNQSS